MNPALLGGARTSSGIYGDRHQYQQYILNIEYFADRQLSPPIFRHGRGGGHLRQSSSRVMPMRTRKLQQFNFAATPPSRLVVVEGRLRGHDEMVEKPCPPEPEGSADRAGTNHDRDRVEGTDLKSWRDLEKWRA